MGTKERPKQISPPPSPEEISGVVDSVSAEDFLDRGFGDVGSGYVGSVGGVSEEDTKFPVMETITPIEEEFVPHEAGISDETKSYLENLYKQLSEEEAEAFDDTKLPEYWQPEEPILVGQHLINQEMLEQMDKNNKKFLVESTLSNEGDISYEELQGLSTWGMPAHITAFKVAIIDKDGNVEKEFVAKVGYWGWGGPLEESDSYNLMKQLNAESIVPKTHLVTLDDFISRIDKRKKDNKALGYLTGTFSPYISLQEMIRGEDMNSFTDANCSDSDSYYDSSSGNSPFWFNVPPSLRDDMEIISITDGMTGNKDRHGKNIYISSDSTSAYAIDNAAGMETRFRKDINPLDSKTIERFWERLVTGAYGRLTEAAKKTKKRPGVYQNTQKVLETLLDTPPEELKMKIKNNLIGSERFRDGYTDSFIIPLLEKMKNRNFFRESVNAGKQA